MNDPKVVALLTSGTCLQWGLKIQIHLAAEILSPPANFYHPFFSVQRLSFFRCPTFSGFRTLYGQRLRPNIRILKCARIKRTQLRDENFITNRPVRTAVVVPGTVLISPNDLPCPRTLRKFFWYQLGSFPQPFIDSLDELQQAEFDIFITILIQRICLARTLDKNNKTRRPPAMLSPRPMLASSQDTIQIESFAYLKYQYHPALPATGTSRILRFKPTGLGRADSWGVP